MMSIYKERAATKTNRFMGEDRLNAKKPIAEWDVLLKLMWKSWNDVFRLPWGTPNGVCSANFGATAATSGRTGGFLQR